MADEYGFGSGYFGANDYDETPPRVLLSSHMRAAAAGTASAVRLRPVRVDSETAASTRMQPRAVWSPVARMNNCAGAQATANLMYSAFRLAPRVAAAADIEPARVQSVRIESRAPVAVPIAAFVASEVGLRVREAHYTPGHAYRLKSLRLAPRAAYYTFGALFSYVDVALPNLVVPVQVKVEPYRKLHIRQTAQAAYRVQGSAYRLIHTRMRADEANAGRSTLRYVWEAEYADRAGWEAESTAEGEWVEQTAAGQWVKQIRR